MPRVAIVSPHSPVLDHDSTRCLHTYENGDCLIQTEAPQLETGESDETPVDQGLLLPQVEATAPGAAVRLAEVDPSTVISAYVELIGPVDRRWMETLTQLGLELLQYQPQNSYLCQGTQAAFEQARQQPFVLDVVPLHQVYKPATVLPEAGDSSVSVVMQGSPDEAETLMREVSALSGVEIDPQQEVDGVNYYLRFRATVSAAGQTALLQHPRVLAVEPYQPPQAEDEVAGLIIAGQYDQTGRPNGSYLQWLEDHGVNGAGVTIGIVDDGVDQNHPAFSDRTKDLSYGKRSWHGTFVAGHAAGCYLEERDNHQFIYGLGMAPKANLLIQDNQRGATALCRETVTETVSGAAGTIQNNSWGMGTANPMSYSSLEATYDQLVRNADPDASTPRPLTLCFSSGNSGAAGLTRPKAAKNLIVTGNSETFRPDIGKDQSDNIHEVYTGPRGSSHGNCGDGRIVPHVVAPGEWTASANFGARPGEREYISARLTWGGGSSGASPKTAGACALLTQWWQRSNQGAAPSPALLKALIVNGAEPMQSGGAIPNPIQGWGRLNLENILDKAAKRVYVDQSHLLTRRGDEKTWSLRVADPRKPVKITLCWTDPPGSLGSGTDQATAVVNKLALRAQVGNQLFRANQFNNGWSYSDGSATREGWDNLQNIFLPIDTVTERFQVTVTALDVTTDCLTGRVMPPQQDFALVMTNVVIDKGQTPTSIFVAADQPQPAQSTSVQDDDFWSAAEPDNDNQDLDEDWWQSTHTASNQSNSSSSSSHVSHGTETSNPPTPADLWWLQDDQWWKSAETERSVKGTDEGTIESTDEDTDLTPSLQAAIAAVTSGGKHRILMASDQTLEAGSTAHQPLLEMWAESQRTLPTVHDLDRSLAQIMAQWHTLGDGQRAAVLVVRSQTRFRRAHLDAMRRLAFWGELYLVSESPHVLTFLAQRITSPSLHLRLAESAAQLGTLLHSTLLEASGGQQAEVRQMTETALDGPIIHHLFQILSVDQRFTVQVPLAATTMPSLELVRPDQSVVALESANSPLVTLLQSDGLLQITLSAAEHSSWAGQWTLRLAQADLTADAPLQVWTWGDLQWQVHSQTTPAASDSSTEATDWLVTLCAPGVTLQRLQGHPRLLTGTASRRPETQRPIDVGIELPRATESAVMAETRRYPVSAPTISTLISLPHQTGAVGLDVPLRVEGLDTAGYPFVRFLRCSFVQREPLSVWRQRRRQTQSVLFTPARIADIHTVGNTVVAMTLTYQGRYRKVEVRSETLQVHLSAALGHRFPDKDVIVGVVGNELYGLYCPLDTFPAPKILPFVPQEVR